MKLTWIITIAILLQLIVLSVAEDIISKQKVEYAALLDLLPEPEPASGGLETDILNLSNPGEGEYLFPLIAEDYLITSPSGKRVSPITKTWLNHNGVDISGIYRAQIQSVASGVVVDYYPPPGRGFKGHPVYGGMITIQHEDGTKALYAHLSEGYVREGWGIEAGEIIGRMGNTGKSTGDHLHFEFYVEDTVVNPLLYITLPE